MPTRGVPGGPTHGSVTVDQSTGTFTYTREAGYTGPDQFKVTVSDAGNGLHFHGLLGFLRPHRGHTSTATITLNIVAANEPPAANDDTYTTPEGIPVLGNVLSNDSDPDNQPLIATVLSGPYNGAVAMAPTGAFSYMPNPGWNGADTFTYSASDRMLSASARVAITVTPVNQAPHTADDSYANIEDTAVVGNLLGNDSDADGDTLTAGLVLPASHGDVQLSSDGSFSYTPNANFHGTDGFSYVASDGSLSSAPTLVTITVAPVNDTPVAQNDIFSFSEDGVLTGSVLSNDTDADADPLTAALTAGPAHGSLTLNPDGSFSYVPVANYSGTDSFTYTVSDGIATSNTATAAIAINPTNDTPISNDSSFSVDEDSTYSGSVSVSDVDGDTLSSVVVTGPAHGSLTLNPNGSFSYTPGPNYNGADSFTFTATDGSATSAPSLVQITVTPINDAPVAHVDSYSVSEDGVLTGSVLFNDTDADGNTLTAALVFGPSHGALTLNSNGSFTYTPDTGYNGPDTFAYTASDEALTSSAAIVSITINPVNNAPVAEDDIYSISEDTPLIANVLTNDTDVDASSLTASLVDGPASGTLNLNADGSFIYTPTSNYNGVDWFTYTASDGFTTSATALVLIMVTPVNDAPAVTDDTYLISEDSALTGNVLSNDVDVDADSLTAALVNGPSHGALTLNPNGSFSYTPAQNYTGTDSFTYTASDGTNVSGTATATITVTADNSTPVATSDSYATPEDSILTGNVLANDTDADGESLTATMISVPTHGTISLAPSGSFTYTPSSNYTGTDSFTYTATDGIATSSVATVAITIDPVNDAPVANGDSFSTNEDIQLTGNVLANDTDIDADTLTASLVDGPAHGTLALNPDGSFTYTPSANYTGADSFTYTATDGTATSSVATVAITVDPINDTPAAANDSFSTNEDIQLTGNVLTNDTDIDADTLTASLVDGPTHGTLTLNPDGSFTYTPSANYTGADSFTYTATDGTATSSVATVAITVDPINDSPAANDDSFTTNEDIQLTGNVLTNDTDIDAGDTLTASLVDGPTHGTLTLNPDGSFTYTPGANYTGADSFTYTASDGTATSSVATVSITVDPVNDAPVANDDSFTTNEDTQLAGNVLSNDTDIDAGDTLSASLVDGPAHGTLALNPDGSFTYTPSTNYTGADSFTYTASDGTATSTAATVSITVSPVNDAPAASDDSFTTNEDTQLAGNVLSNDTDIDAGDTVTASLVDGPTHGTLTLNGDGSFTYTPGANYTGSDSFTYIASDGIATSSIATVSITVDPVNDAPVASDDSFTTDEDTQLAGSVLANDTDIDAGDTLAASLVDGPTHGTLTLNPDGSFTYTPGANYTGSDSFTYTATDGTATSTAATVSITVSPVNDAPAANDDSFTTNEDTQLAGNVLSNDTDIDAGDTLSASLVDGPAHGTLALNPDGSFTYTPSSNYTGPDSFTYTASDGIATSSVATVSITVNPVNDAPVASDDSFTTDEDTQLAGSVLANDTDIDAGDTLAASLVDGPTHGTLTLNPDGSFTYTPGANYTGSDSFTYTATDGTATSSVATVSITVDPVNDAPVANNDSLTLNEDSTLTGNVLANDTDVEGEPLTVTLIDEPTHGTLTLNPDGSFTYTLIADYNGADSFSYTASDGTATSNTATVTVTINPVNDTPVAEDDSFTGDEDNNLAAGVLANGVDVDGDPLTVTLVDGPAHGTLTLDPDGSFSYTPGADYNGDDSFTYTASDGTATSNTATITITINPVNDAPVANNDSYSTGEDSTLTGDVLSNDVDVDGNTVTASVLSGPAHGTLTLNPDGSFLYVPATNYNGVDSFTYTANDGTLTDAALVTISISSVEDAPVAANDSYTTNEDTQLSGNVLTNDTDADGNTLTASLVTGPAHGSLTLNSDGSFTYTPTANYNGADSFTYTANDGTATSSIATVSITLSPVNDAPAAVNNSYTTDEDTPLTGNVLTNDTDADGNTLTASLVTGPTHGSLTLNSDGTFTYTPTANYTGTDAFTYRANDGIVNSNTAIVAITITAVNDAPVATNDTYATNEDTALNGNVVSNDADADGNTLTTSLVSGPAHGSLTLNSDGSFTYTPTANYNGADSFTYTASDGTATSNTATVSVTVNAVNDTPVATNDTATTNQDTVLNGNVLSNDTDADGNSLTASLVAGPTHGSLTLNPDGSFSYTPAASYNGTDSFTYTASDGTATSTVATVSITVVDNVAPTAVGVQTTNSGTNGLMQQGDTITYTFSEPIDPASILAGWTGASTNVVVRAYDGNILLGLLGGNDSLQVYNSTNTSLLPLGAVELGRPDYVTGLLGGTITFGDSGTPSTMTMTGNTITIVLGTYDSVFLGAVRSTASGTGAMTWTPSTTPDDLAGNALSGTPVTESGTADRDF